MRTPLSQRAQQAAASVTNQRVTIATQNVHKALSGTLSEEDAQDATYHLLSANHQGGPFVVAQLDDMVFTEKEGVLHVLIDASNWDYTGGWRRVLAVSDLHQIIPNCVQARDALLAKEPKKGQLLPTPEVP